MKAWRDPCLVSRSKSGGVHIIAFADDWVPADRMRAYLIDKRDEVLDSDVIEHAGEVFPKQSEGSGSQMNLPAFGDERQVIAWRSATVLEVVLLFRPVCSLVKMDQGFIQAAILMGSVLLSYASFGVNIPWIECGRSAL